MTSFRKWIAVAAASLTAGFLVAPGTISAGIVDLLTFQAAVDAAQAVDPTLAAPTNDGNHDFAVGGFERSNTPTNGGHTGFSAQSHPNGQAPSGHLSSTFDSSPTSLTPGVKERYDVVCLAVSGNEAAIGMVPTSSPKTNTGMDQVLAVEDSGMPGGAGDMYAFYIGADPTDCATYLGGAVFPPLRGNILVHDES
jgi:hypothetical protein